MISTKGQRRLINCPLAGFPMNARWHLEENWSLRPTTLLFTLLMLGVTCAAVGNDRQKLEKLASQCPRKVNSCREFAKAAEGLPPAEWGILDEFTTADTPQGIRGHAVRAMCRLVGRISNEAELENAATLAHVDCARTEAARQITNQQFLAEIALNDKSPDVRTAAIRHLSDQAQILRVFSTSPQWADRKLAFGQMDALGLATLLGSNRDPAVRTACEVRLGKRDWGTVISDAQRCGKLGDALGAVALVDRQAGLESAVPVTVIHYIPQGDSSRIPELKELLALYGDTRLAEVYLNCGQPDLSAAGGAWATAHGYSIWNGNSSNRVIWGSAR